MTPTLSITRERITFDGRLEALRPHRHATLVHLWGADQPFRLTTRGQSEMVQFALVPAGVEHALDFTGQRALVIYIEPHDPEYAGNHRAASGRCLTHSELPSHFGSALELWEQRRDVSQLLALGREQVRPPEVTLDERLRTIAHAFNEGRLLDASVEQLAREVHLSPSRLTHLLKQELGTGFRRLKQYYRFKLAAQTLSLGSSLTTAAHEAGFADSAHFSRAFSETFGLTPAKIFRRELDYRHDVAE